MTSNIPGRSCPLHYRYSPSVFASPAEDDCEVLYVVGGLYGNTTALAKVLELFEREHGAVRGEKRLVFNGDFNWFNVDDAAFQRINQTVLGFTATRGNVETELGSDQGCGCGYPDWVGDQVVAWSNTIMQRLQGTAARFPALTQQLQALPMWRRFDVGGRRVAIVHGDAESLAGWGFATESLREPEHLRLVRGWFDQAQVDIFASTHTCLPIFQTLAAEGADFAPMVLNNGAAGMPNFAGAQEGLLTRIATRPFSGPERRFGIARGGLFLDAISINIDPAKWRPQFLASWPAGSAAHNSYWQRINQGPRHTLAQAMCSTSAI